MWPLSVILSGWPVIVAFVAALTYIVVAPTTGRRIAAAVVALVAAVAMAAIQAEAREAFCASQRPQTMLCYGSFSLR